MNHHESIITLVGKSSVIVQWVLLLLLFCSFSSFAIILRNIFVLRDVNAKNKKFERIFWSGKSLESIFEWSKYIENYGGMWSVFRNGYIEFAKCSELRIDVLPTLDGTRSAMRASLRREVRHLRYNLAFLDSIGVVSPYLGFIGMFLGVISSLIDINPQHSIVWSEFAHGLSVPLSGATMGLGLAMLARFMYRRFSDQIYIIEEKIEVFIEEFCNILRRNLHGMSIPQNNGSSDLESRASGPLSNSQSESTTGRLIEVRLPDMGDCTSATVSGIIVKTGDSIGVDQLLFKLGSGIHAMDVRSSTMGTVIELKVAPGQIVTEGALLLVLEASANAASPVPASIAVASELAPAPAPATAPQVVDRVEVRVPDIGDFKDVTVIDVLIKLGDRVAAGQSLIKVESDRASMEIKSSAAGVVRELMVNLGVKVSEGSLLLVLETDNHAAVAAPAPDPYSQLPNGRTQIRLTEDVFEDGSGDPVMVILPAGRFLMGSPEEESGRVRDEGPQHWVDVPRFAIAKYAVTQGQWHAVMGDNPSRFKDSGSNYPVENVSWDDAQEFVRLLSQRTGKNYRLPTEAEWEYAARAGTTTAYFWGDRFDNTRANSESNGTVEVGSYPANAFGLHEMHGNVWEWVQDVWHDSYVGAPIDGSAWLSGGKPLLRVLRGGSWRCSPWDLRSAYRKRYGPNDHDSGTGFRIARSV